MLEGAKACGLAELAHPKHAGGAKDCVDDDGGDDTSQYIVRYCSDDIPVDDHGSPSVAAAGQI